MRGISKNKRNDHEIDDFAEETIKQNSSTRQSKLVYIASSEPWEVEVRRNLLGKC